MENRLTSAKIPTICSIGGWIVSIVVIATGILNIFLVHPVPGVIYLLISLVYLPPANVYLKNKFAITIPVLLKLILAFTLLMFTLGVSDLGDMIDKL
jgi:hypothetical protein